MNKRNLLLGGLLVLGVTATACGLAACGPAEPPKEEIPEITETVRYTEKTNPYAELTWQEYATVDDWADKLVNAPVYYQFDGSYSEAWQGNYSRDYIYINCYEDGSLHAELRENGTIKDLYGYWTNVTNRGRESLVMNVVSYAGHEYKGSEIVCDSISGGYYEYSSNIIIEKNNGRTIPISGLHHSPIKSLTVTTSDISKGCIIGDSMSYSGLVVTVNRENGKSIAIDSQSYTDPLCRVKFSGFDSSEAGDSEVTVSYVYTDITATYNVKVMGVKSIEADTANIVKEYIEGDKFNSDGLVINATREDDVVVELDSKKYKVVAPEDWGTVGEQEITVTYGENLSTTYTVKIFAVKGIALDTSAVEKTYKVGDKLNTEGLVVSATRSDDVVVDLELNKCKIETGDGWGTPGQQTVTVKFGEHQQTYTVNMAAAVYSGSVNGKDVSLKMNSLTDCEYTYDGTKYILNYAEKNLHGYDQTVYNFIKPEDSSITDEIWNILDMRFVLDKENSTVVKHIIYEIPSTNANGQDIKVDGVNLRTEYEIFPVGGGSEMRFLVIDEENETATISYKYWYHNSKDTFVCKYTLVDGVLTLTEEVSAQVGGSGANFGSIHKVWQLHDDYTATKVKPAEES